MDLDFGIVVERKNAVITEEIQYVYLSNIYKANHQAHSVDSVFLKDVCLSG